MVFRHFQKLPEDFLKNILGGVILVYNHSSEQPVCNLTKRMILLLIFPGEIFKNGWLWTAAFERSTLKISKKTFLVESF